MLNRFGRSALGVFQRSDLGVRGRPKSEFACTNCGSETTDIKPSYVVTISGVEKCACFHIGDDIEATQEGEDAVNGTWVIDETAPGHSTTAAKCARGIDSPDTYDHFKVWSSNDSSCSGSVDLTENDALRIDLVFSASSWQLIAAFRNTSFKQWFVSGNQSYPASKCLGPFTTDNNISTPCADVGRVAQNGSATIE